MTARPWVLVTGAGQRLGRAVALHLGAHGWNVAAHHNSSAATAETAAAEIRTGGGVAVTIGADLSYPAAAAAIVARAAAAAGAPLTALVNCAAIFEHDLADTFTSEGFDRHMHVNALAPALLAQAFAAALPDDAHGAIVNFLDFKLVQPYPDHFTYTLSKYALAGATELLARALAPRVRVNAVAPGYALPSPGQADADFERLHAATPLAYGATPDDIAGAVRYLLEAPAVTGQTIYVDAGLRFWSRDRDLAFS
jgi:NAD(P)-dependent dehydrogenase (short-subunit alcohol dehydrogenase family)